MLFMLDGDHLRQMITDTITLVIDDVNHTNGSGSSSNNNNLSKTRNVLVPRLEVQNSKLFSDLITMYNTVLFFPKQYNDVVDSYILYLNTQYVRPDTIKRCLELCHYLSDDKYLSTIVTVLLFNDWKQLSSSSYNNKRKIFIDDLGINLQTDVYLKCPWYLIPEQFIVNNSFVNQWIQVNKHKKFIIHGNEYTHNVNYHEEITDQVKSVEPTLWNIRNDIYGYTHGMMLEMTELLVSKITTYQKGHKHGTSKSWFININNNNNNKQLRSEAYYTNDDKDGCFRGWLETGQLVYEHNYKCGDKHGIWKGWTESGQQLYNHHYQNNSKHVLNQEWYSNGELCYESVFKHGKKITCSSDTTITNYNTASFCDHNFYYSNNEHDEY